MIKNNEQFTSTANKNIDNINEFLKFSLKSLEKLTSLQLNASKKLLSETTDTVKGIAQTNNPKDLFEKVNQLATNSVESNMVNCREVFDIMAEVQAEAGKYIENQIQSAQDNLVNVVDDLTKFNSVAKSSAASESIKTWLDSTNQAMSTVTKFAQQISDYTNSSLNTATKATEEVIKKSSKK